MLQRHGAKSPAELSADWNVSLPDIEIKEATMPVLLIPVLWIGGTALLLGGGYFLVSNVLVR